MGKLVNEFTSTGSKLFHHQEVMAKLRNKQGQPIVTHLMATDLCQHTCAFCSVATRTGASLPLDVMEAYLDQLVPLGLKAAILSGGGNPILYRKDKADFNDLVAMVHGKGLEIGVITNGMRMKEYPCGRRSWATVRPETLDLCKWIRVSMSGFDHEEREVYVPDVDPSKTTLGFSYVYHDCYQEPLEPNHGKVSTPLDLVTPLQPGDGRVEYGKDRLPWLRDRFAEYVTKYKPVYMRLLPNCLEPHLIADRCQELQQVADSIDPQIVFVQYKPPSAPSQCFLGYPHPVLNSDGYVYPCDAVVLSVADLGYKMGKPDHKFDSPWRMCHWTEIGELYKKPVKSLVDSRKLCAGCVFTKTNELLEAVVDGMDTPVPAAAPQHVNFV